MFDKQISLRMIVVGAALAHVAGLSAKLNMPTEIVDAVGALVGYCYDLLAFQLKSRLARS